MVPASGKAGLCQGAEPYRHAFARGDGVEKNGTEALFWLTLAARQGHWTAKVNKESLAAKLGKDVLQNAERRADGWKRQ